jgi:beta-1,4-mannosyl-glycoprotein beta-1,4-N-acetylglucosaminyltransferase
MIYDCLLFFNEIDLLKIRIEELKNDVDKFIIVESNKSFSGERKPLYFKDFEHEFREYKDKIIYHLVEDMPEIKENNRWPLEAHQRNSIAKAFKKCNCKDDDTILISDADEIPKASKVKEAEKILQKYPFVVFMEMNYRFFLNNIGKCEGNREFWDGTIACKYRMINLFSIQNIRRAEKRAGRLSKFHSEKTKEDYLSKTSTFYLSEGGWHLQSLGGPDSIEYKMDNYSHGNPEKKDNAGIYDYNDCRSNLQNNINYMKSIEKENIELFPEKDYEFIPILSDEDFAVDKNLPEYLKQNKHKYKHFFKFSKPYVSGKEKNGNLFNRF